MALDERDINPNLNHELGAEASFGEGEVEQMKKPEFGIPSALIAKDIPQVEPLDEPKLVAHSGEGEAVLEILPEQVSSELDQKAKEENLLDMLNGEVGEDKSAAWEEIEGLSQIQ